MRLWDEIADMPIGRDGIADTAGFLHTEAQAERWQAFGYAIADAVDSYRAFLRKWESYQSEKRADDYCLAWFEHELKRALEYGIPPDDPDLWRIRAASKHHEAYKAVTMPVRKQSIEQDSPLPLWDKLDKQT